MATVQVFTAARTQEIEDQAIVGGAVVGDNLILTRNNGDTINAGIVKGETGDTGPVGETILPGLTALWLFPTIPTGWLSLEGQSIANANTLYPSLWTSPYIPSDWKAGTTLNLPNMKGRVAVHQDTAQTEFDTLLETGGGKTTTLSTANLPPHPHDMGHDHPSGLTGPGGAHYHELQRTDGAYSIGYGETYRTTTGSFTSEWQTFMLTTTNPNRAIAVGVNDHNHTFDVAPFSGNTGNGPGSATPINNIQPYMVVRYIIKT